MSKEKSTIIKGVAILLMIFLHLFNHDITKDCSPFFFIGDTPFVTILTRACGPVPFFLIISGYGLHYTYTKKGLSWNSQLRRILKLFVTYWLVLAIFVSIGSFIRQDKYPGTIIEAILNISSWSNSYNIETWFLFPYAVLAIFAVYIFRIIDKLGNLTSFVLFTMIGFIAMYITSRYISAHKTYDSFFAHIITIANLSFSFAIGAILHRIAEQRSLDFGWAKSHQPLILFFIIALVAIRCLTTVSAWQTFFALFFILLFIQFELPSTIKRLLIKLGEYSMPMWMTHTFFSAYLFHGFIYGFQYPLLIYIILVIISFFISIPIMIVSRKIIQVARI